MYLLCVSECIIVCLYRPSSYDDDDDDADTNLRLAALSLASSTACCMLLSCFATFSLMHFTHVDPDFFRLLYDRV